jgi:membrane-bound metal-dependent hydrolase YbcI (DUF457 family)
VSDFKRSAKNKMTPVSHALLPVFLGQRWIPENRGAPSIRLVSLIALCGALPDILSPHLYLDDRHTAYSHSILAFLVFASIVILAAKINKLKLSTRIYYLCILAYGGHIFCDAITGGVALYYPFSLDVTGKNYLPYWLWITIDGALVLYLYLVYRWIPLRRKMHRSKCI